MQTTDTARRFCQFLFSLALLCASGGSVASFGAAVAAADREGQLVEVVATGVGLAPEKAKQNAFFNAIEQVVGVLVDAETLVQNDRIVYDQVLTFSRGEVKEFTLLRQWQQDGLHCARIRARVAVDKLANRLQEKQIELQPLDGEKLVANIKYRNVNQENAFEMLKSFIAKFRIENLVKVEIVGEPETVEENKVRARLRVKVRVTSADPKRWQATFRREARTLFRRLSGEPLSFSGSTERYADSEFFGPITAGKCKDIDGKNVSDEMFQRQKKGTKPACWICLLGAAEPDGQRTIRIDWEAFQFPRSFSPAFNSVVGHQYQIRLAFLDADNNVLVQAQHKLAMLDYPMRNVYVNPDDWMTRDVYWLAPSLWADWFYSPSFVAHEFLIDVDLDDLNKCTKKVAFIEEIEDQ